jgi:hypothetical protein
MKEMHGPMHGPVVFEFGLFRAFSKAFSGAVSAIL